MKVLVTGGCGYIGSSLIMNLSSIDKIDEVVIYDNLCYKRNNIFFGDKVKKNKVRFIQGDILDQYKLKKSLNDIDVVFHLAALVSTPFADQQNFQYDQVNNWGTAILVDAIENTPQVSKLIYLSSIAVYGDTRGSEVNEDSITAPSTYYGVSKLNGEKHIERLKHKIETKIVRVGNVFGYNDCMRLDAVINKFVFEAHIKNRIEIHGNGNQNRAFAHIDYVSQFLSSLSTSDKMPNMSNLISCNISINQIVNILRLNCLNLEVYYLDQHIQMRSITVKSKFLSVDESNSLIDESIKNIKSRFRF